MKVYWGSIGAWKWKFFVIVTATEWEIEWSEAHLWFNMETGDAFRSGRFPGRFPPFGTRVQSLVPTFHASGDGEKSWWKHRNFQWDVVIVVEYFHGHFDSPVFFSKWIMCQTRSSWWVLLNGYVSYTEWVCSYHSDLKKYWWRSHPPVIGGFYNHPRWVLARISEQIGPVSPPFLSRAAWRYESSTSQLGFFQPPFTVRIQRNLSR